MPTCSLIRKSHCKTRQLFWVISFYSLMKHFSSDGSCLFHDDKAPIHRAPGVTEWFDDYENDVGHKLCPSHPIATIILGDFGQTWWTALSTTIIKTPNKVLCLRRNVLSTHTVYAKEHLSCYGGSRWPSTSMHTSCWFFLKCVTPLCVYKLKYTACTRLFKTCDSILII